MTTRTVLSLLGALSALACSPRNLPGTDIRDTLDTRAIYDVVQAYRKAMEARDPKAVLALVADDYFDNGGTPDPSDDLDRARLEQALTADLARAEALRLDLTIRKMIVEGDRAEAELFYDEYYRVETPTGPVPKRESDVHRMKLKKVAGAWRVTSGL
jgi:hypothetical protein